MSKNNYRKCNKCGKIMIASNDRFYCSECVKILRSYVYSYKKCKDCGTEIYGGPRKIYCESCAAIRRKEAQMKLRKNGSQRPLGTIDQCKRCGKDYVVTSGRAKYCKDCKKIAVLENQREIRKAYNKQDFVKKAKQERRNNKIKICKYCLCTIQDNKSSKSYCSDYCKNESRKINYAVVDINRGISRDLDKLYQKRELYRNEKMFHQKLK